jgi:hypothetical protein
MKIGYHYFLFSGVIFLLMSVYLLMNNQTIQILEENNIPSKSIAFIILFWGCFRMFKGYKLYLKQKNDEN